MARAIADAFVYFLGVLAVAALPLLALGYFGLARLNLISGVLVNLLAGFLIGEMKEKYLHDNITTSIVSLGVMGFLAFFLRLPPVYVLATYIIGYLMGVRMKERPSDLF
jgi:hypothetical protein